MEPLKYSADSAGLMIRGITDLDMGHYPGSLFFDSSCQLFNLEINFKFKLNPIKFKVEK